MINRKTGAVIGMFMLAAGICLTGCERLKQLRTQKTEIAADPITIDVRVDKVVRTTLQRERKLLGALEPIRETDIAPQAPGRVRSLAVKVGDFVSRGQVVARMDDAQLVATDAQFQQVRANYERMKSLYASNAVPRSQFEAVEAAYAAMKRQIENLQENTTLAAPFPGVVTATYAEEGEMYSGGMVPGMPGGLVHLSQLDPLKIDLKVDDRTVQFVRKGTEVRIRIDALPDHAPLSGKVDYVNPQADLLSKTFEVRIIVPNGARLLRPGFFAEVGIVIGEKTDVLAIARSAIVDDRVFIVKNSVALARTVTLGWQTDDAVEVLTGLAENELVVVAGNKALPDSARVNIVK